MSESVGARQLEIFVCKFGFPFSLLPGPVAAGISASAAIVTVLRAGVRYASAGEMLVRRQMIEEVLLRVILFAVFW